MHGIPPDAGGRGYTTSSVSPRQALVFSRALSSRLLLTVFSARPRDYAATNNISKLMYCSVFTLHYSPNTLSFPALRSSGGASTVPVRELPRSGKSSSGVDLGGGHHYTNLYSQYRTGQSARQRVIRARGCPLSGAPSTSSHRPEQGVHMINFLFRSTSCSHILGRHARKVS